MRTGLRSELELESVDARDRPGGAARVEFDHDRVMDFGPIVLAQLSRVIDAQPHMLYEAHSTDYQTAAICAPWCAAWFCHPQGWRR